MSRASANAAAIAGVLCWATACGDDDQLASSRDAAAPASPGDAARPPLYDAAEPFEPPPFEAGAPVSPNPAFNPRSPPDAGPSMDAAAPVPPRPGGCLEIEPGERVRFEGELTDQRTWYRIEAVEACPAQALTRERVAYRPYTLCPSNAVRVFEIVMRGADMLDVPPRSSVADPFLAVYEDEAQATDDPFDCVASSDNGLFDGLESNSARIERLELAAGRSVVVFASSAERPDQRGVGLFELEISAE